MPELLANSETGKEERPKGGPGAYEREKE